MKLPDPCGTNVLIEALKVEEVSAGGILLNTDTVRKEQTAECRGRVLAIGPTAYSGWHGCDQEGKKPHECWGINVGDVIEYRKYEALDSTVKEEGKLYRYVNDIDIKGVISHE